MDSNTSFDIIVIGVGSMGSATCYYLSKQGYKVLGLEQFDITHEFGSHRAGSALPRGLFFWRRGAGATAAGDSRLLGGCLRPCI